MNKSKKQYDKAISRTMDHLQVMNVVHRACTPSDNWTKIREHYLLLHVVAGAAQVQVGYKQYELTVGSTILVYPNEKISFIVPEQGTCEYYAVGLLGDFMDQVVQNTPFSELKSCIADQHQLAQGFVEVYLSEGVTFSKMIGRAGATYRLLAELVALNETADAQEEDNYARRAEEFIGQHYSESLNAEMVAKHLGISRSHLHRVFLDVFGLPMGKYISKLRLERASYLLLNTRLAINEISDAVGFENQLYFSNAFKKFSGVSPSLYRKNNL